MPSTKLRVAELREICRGMGLDHRGTKKELLRRITVGPDDEGPDFPPPPPAPSTPPSTPPRSPSQQIQDDYSYRAFREEQDQEYYESLNQDRIKTVNNAIEDNDFTGVPVADIKLALESRGICYKDAIEKSDLIGLLMPEAPAESESDHERSDEFGAEEHKEDENEEDDRYRLDRDALRAARLRFFS